MKNIIISMLGCMTIVSCQQVVPFVIMDEVARKDAMVCVSATLISSNIRENPELTEGYAVVSHVLQELIEDNPRTREEVENELVEAFSLIFSEIVVDQLVGDVMQVYDRVMNDLQSSEEVIETLKATKSAIDSGVELFYNTERPVSVVAPVLKQK